MMKNPEDQQSRIELLKQDLEEKFKWLAQTQGLSEEMKATFQSIRDCVMDCADDAVNPTEIPRVWVDESGELMSNPLIVRLEVAHAWLTGYIEALQETDHTQSIGGLC